MASLVPWLFSSTVFLSALDMFRWRISVIVCRDSLEVAVGSLSRRNLSQILLKFAAWMTGSWMLLFVGVSSMTECVRKGVSALVFFPWFLQCGRRYWLLVHLQCYCGICCLVAIAHCYVESEEMNECLIYSWAESFHVFEVTECVGNRDESGFNDCRGGTFEQESTDLEILVERKLGHK